MGRSVYMIAKECAQYYKTFEIKGFLDDNIHALDGFHGYPSVLETISDYQVKDNDCFVCSMGNVRARKNVSEIIEGKGGVFISLIHPQARIGINSFIGEGCIIAPYCSIGCDSKIEGHSLIQSFAVIGHDCVIGKYSRIDTHATCVGGVRVGELVTIHTSAVLNHKVVVENEAVIGACSFVIKRVKLGETVYSNPAKKL